MNVRLHAATDARWLPQALAHFDDVLIDHAHCEKKAAANALSMLQAYPEIPGLPIAMARLAHEESDHLARVLRLMEGRGLALGRDSGDPYAQGLQELIRKTQPERRLDRFLVAALIEARSCERLALLAGGLTDPPLRKLYTELAQSEDGHQALFLQFAHAAHPADAVEERLTWMSEREAALIQRLPIRPAIH